MCIKMLQILNTGRTYKVSELADLLETNPRNVIEYKKELDEVVSDSFGTAGFYIETIPGRYGGYRLHGDVAMPALRLTENEKVSFIEALDYLSSRNDFMAKNDFQVAVGKVFAALITKEIKKEENVLIINRYPLVMPQEEIEHRYNVIKVAIKQNKKIKFNYLSQKNTVKERIFDPYELFMYNNAWFVIGWLNSENHPGVCWFKLNRMQDISMTNEKYTMWKYYHKADYIDEYGFKSNGEWYHVEFIAHETYASLCRERIYGKNQVVEVIDDNSTKVSVDMQNKENIRVFILGFGENLDVLEPDWLKEDLKNIANAMLEKYR